MEESFLESFGRLSLRQQQQPPRPPAPPPPRGTPPRRHSFRKHLYLLRGLPGSGKTTLARRTAVGTAPGASPRWHRPPRGPCPSRAGSLRPQPRSAGSAARGQSSSGKPDGDCRGNRRAARWYAGTRHGAATGVLNLSGEAGAQGQGLGPGRAAA
ncbi:hypothetical protein J1605_007186 [Eschrichtius robustus]|uniref:NEDD4-binding protein 2-like 1 n=1 Tax=Eschrichtius robustus TaxID=9764 RepID=A0AB34H1L0_ESCRO|nr:hypothetical protein J1605_007186 [Eschrichtius robustus]